MTRLCPSLLLLSLLCLLGGWAQPSVALARAVEPASDAVLSIRRFSLVVGANDGGDDRVTLRYAVSDADLVGDVLRRFGGVSNDDHVRLSDPSPEALFAALEGLAVRIKAAKASGQHIQFVFYYSGHSDEQGLLLAGRRVDYKTLRKKVQAVPADVRIAVLDSCASGAFTRTKGGVKRAPFLINAGSEVTGHAFLTSSSIDEAAQESDRIGGSFFTHYFATGLRGAADVDGDRLITLSEAYQFAFDETLARTEATHGGAQHAAYDIQLAGSGDLVMTDLRKTNARLVVAAEVGGRISVRNAQGQLAAELYKPPGAGAIGLALEPGRYQITIDDGRDLWRTEVEVSSGGQTTVTLEGLSRLTPEATTQRGDVVPVQRDAPPTTVPPAMAATEAEPEPDYQTVPINLGLFPPLSINGQDGSGKPIRNVASFSLVFSRAARLDVFAMAIGGTVIDGPNNGVQFAWAFNKSQTLDGAQFAFLTNITTEGNGAQLGAGLNFVERFSGFQGGLVNRAKVVSRGAQVGAIDITGHIKGAQVGLINVGGSVDGAQVGLINIAGHSTASVGLLSITREGNVHPEVSLSDASLLNVALRFPARRTYSFIEGGITPAGRGAGWQVGLGFGVHIPLAHSLFLDVDLSGYAAFTGLDADEGPNPLFKLRPMVGWAPRKRLSIFAGPTLNLLGEIDTNEFAADRAGAYQFSALDYTNLRDGWRVRMWPGFVTGVRF